MPTRLRTGAVLLALGLVTGLSGCALTREAPGFPAPAAPARPAGAGSATPAPGTPAAPSEATPVPSPERPYVPPPKQFRLSAASQALVTQAHQQSAGGDYAGAAATLERALRIEPDNPLLWTELGRIRMGENNPAQAEAMGRKALALATGDAAAQSSAWHLIADGARTARRPRPNGARPPPAPTPARAGPRHSPGTREPQAGLRWLARAPPAPYTHSYSSRPAEGLGPKTPGQPPGLTTLERCYVLRHRPRGCRQMSGLRGLSGSGEDGRDISTHGVPRRRMTLPQDDTVRP
jgi:hypothetical protein